MKKGIKLSIREQRINIDGYIGYRLLPNRYIEAIGPFLNFDHLPLGKHSHSKLIDCINKNDSYQQGGSETLTYILNHEPSKPDRNIFQSKEPLAETKYKNKCKKSFYNEMAKTYPGNSHLVAHVIQFWISNPAREKTLVPKSLSIDTDKIPTQLLSDNSGWLKLIIGEYENPGCKFRAGFKQFLYHIHLNPQKHISTTTETGLEYAIFLPLHDAVVNDIEFKKGDVIEFDTQEGTIEITNTADTAVDIIVFGGESIHSQ